MANILERKQAREKREAFVKWLCENGYQCLRQIEGFGAKATPEFEMWAKNGVIFVVQFFVWGGIEVYSCVTFTNDLKVLKKQMEVITYEKKMASGG